jgi:hypothetical protein
MKITITQGDTYTGNIILTTSATTEINNGTVYRVKSDSITYDGTIYTLNDTFTGTAVTTYTGDGTFGEVIDITGWKFYFTVKANKDDTDAEVLLTKDLDVLTDPTNGLTLFTFTHEETEHLPVGNFWIEIKWENALHSIYTFYPTSSFIVKDSLRDTL